MYPAVNLILSTYDPLMQIVLGKSNESADVDTNLSLP